MRLLLFIAFFIFSSSTLAQHANIKQEIDKIIRYDIEWNQEYTPGFLLAIVDGDSSWVFSYGENLDPNKDTLDSLDLFNIGGIGLVELAFSIISDGYDLDTQLSDINPSWWDFPIGSLSIKRILNHSAGFSKIPRGIGRDQSDSAHPYKDWSKEDAYRYYQSLTLESFKDQWNYSYHGYALLADELFKSCEVISGVNRTPGITKSLVSAEPTDWGYLSTLLSGTRTIEELITLSRSIMPILPTLEHIPTEHKHVNHNGLMYHSIHAHKYDVYSHSSRSDGHYVHLGIVPKTRTSVIIMANGELGLNDLGILVLRMINGNWKRIKS